ncbi:hypothetical protein SNEBB_008209 [Seison nebaliae]|nr:hypothetical protein SNEBB_008209 [Seison nebaliae]
MSNKEQYAPLQLRYQSILSNLLKSDDNKYCVECDGKGPRWASWNLGIFLCMRCAGIHRKLGVHISRVKSVNLDTWKPQEIAQVQDMGNSRARAVYEARLPDNYKRPQTDMALEQFIRMKYDHKKWIASEWTGGMVEPSPDLFIPHSTNNKSSKFNNITSKKSMGLGPIRAPDTKMKTNQISTPTPPAKEVNLLDLDFSDSQPAKSFQFHDKSKDHLSISQHTKSSSIGGITNNSFDPFANTDMGTNKVESNKQSNNQMLDALFNSSNDGTNHGSSSLNDLWN